MAPAIATYEPRDPSSTVLYKVIADHLETFLASCEADPDAKGLPAYVERELYDYLQCGVLAHGFLRLGCDTCQHEMLLAFSCKPEFDSCLIHDFKAFYINVLQVVPHVPRLPFLPIRVRGIFSYLLAMKWIISIPMYHQLSNSGQRLCL
jgi:hypothetical protein